jgi:hypothetical protein
MHIDVRAGLERLQRFTVGADQFDRADIGGFYPNPPDSGMLNAQFTCFPGACRAKRANLQGRRVMLRRIADSTTILSAKPAPAANAEV